MDMIDPGTNDVQLIMDYENTCAQLSKYMNAGSRFKPQVRILTKWRATLMAEIDARKIRDMLGA